MATKNTTPLTNLTEVELSECRQCQQLPTFGQLPFLNVLILRNFQEVKCIGNEFYENTSKIITTAGKEVCFPSLKKLQIKCFWKVTTWMPPSQALAEIAFPNLDTLEINDCPMLELVPDLEFPSLLNLQFVDVGGTQPLEVIQRTYPFELKVMMDQITSLSENLQCWSMLEKLDITCDKLTSLPTGFRCLTSLIIDGCSSLTYIPDDAFYPSLRTLRIIECRALKRVPMSIGECKFLVDLQISMCPSIEGPIPILGDKKMLRYLLLFNSGELMRSIAKWISGLPSLCELSIGGEGFTDEGEFEKILTTQGLDLREKPGLQTLVLTDIPKITFLPKQLQILFPTRLEILEICEFKELEVLPDWICELSYLRKLVLDLCKNLKHLPSGLSQLQSLVIIGCPQLEITCDRNYGPDFFKISHIPHIVINGKSVNDRSSILQIC